MKYELRETKYFRRWIRKADRTVRIQVAVRLTKVENGNLGDHKSVGGGVSELRFHARSGTRIYYTKQGVTLVLLLLGGEKSNQKEDIKKAKKILKELTS